MGISKMKNSVRGKIGIDNGYGQGPWVPVSVTRYYKKGIGIGYGRERKKRGTPLYCFVFRDGSGRGSGSFDVRSLRKGGSNSNKTIEIFFATR